MRSNRKILFGLALILGAFLLYRGFVFLSNLGGPPRPVVARGGAGSGLQTVSAPASTGRIAQAAVDIPANSIVTPDMLRMVPYSGPSTKGFITDIEAQGAGFITRRQIPLGGQIRPDEDFIGHVSETGIAGLLQPGRRAMIVPIANKPTLHDLVRIGNFVDVLAAFDGQESRTLVEDVRVLGVDVSAGDYPNVNAAMRGPFKAAPKTNVPVGDSTTGASTPGSAVPVPQPNSAGPAATPTAVPANVPRPDPALILEVTPRQAASIQLALASNAPLDFLVRPALPANRSIELAPVTNPNAPTATIISANSTSSDAGTSQAVSVTKPQIAPYAEARKAAGGGGGKNAGNRSNGTLGGGAGRKLPLLPRGGPRPVEAVPNFPGDNGNIPLPPASVNVSSPARGNSAGGVGTSGTHPYVAPSAPALPQTYTIPVYGDGKILRQETVPLPAQ